MVPFAGFDMPIQYETGPVEEHLATRRSVGLFDIDHMGQVEISGPGSDEYVSGIVSAGVLGMTLDDAKYSLLLNERGTVIDDLFIYRLKGRWWVVVNASNRDTDVAWFKRHAPSGVTVTDRSDETYMIAVQGPKAIDLLDAVSSVKISAFPRFTSGEATIDGVRCLVGRTGYTGEDGVELFFPSGSAPELWEHLLAEGKRLGIETKPIGLAARDSLRFEAGMPLHGHEISADINAVEAGFKWACDFEKDFMGRDALLKIQATGPERKLVLVEVTGGVPREGYEVTDASGTPAGKTVSGMFCPTVKKFACNALVDPACSKTGTPLKVIIHGKPRDGLVVKKPLYVPAYRR